MTEDRIIIFPDEEEQPEEEYVPKAIQYVQTKGEEEILNEKMERNAKIEARLKKEKEGAEMVASMMSEENLDIASDVINIFSRSPIVLCSVIFMGVPAAFYLITAHVDKILGFQPRFEGRPSDLEIVSIVVSVMVHAFMSMIMTAKLSKTMSSLAEGGYYLDTSGFSFAKSTFLTDAGIIAFMSLVWFRVSAAIIGSLFVIMYVTGAIAIVRIENTIKSAKPKKLPFILWMVCFVISFACMGITYSNIEKCRNIGSEYELYAVMGVACMAVLTLVLGIAVISYNYKTAMKIREQNNTIIC